MGEDVLIRVNDHIVLRETASLIPYANNSRTHTETQIVQIAASIKEFGFTNPVLLDGECGIVAGHARVIAARLLKMEQVPCIELCYLTEAQRKAYVIADNKLAVNAGWDDQLLAIELKVTDYLKVPHLPMGVVLDQLSCAHPVDRVASGAERHAERTTRCGAFLRGDQKPVPGPGVGERLVRRRADRVHPGDVEPDELLEIVDAGARDLSRGLQAGRDRDPPALLPADIFGAEQHLAVLLDQRGHKVVDWFKIVGLGGRVPIRELQDVVAGSCLPFGCGG
jgi:ParB-like nuclease domain